MSGDVETLARLLRGCREGCQSALDLLNDSSNNAMARSHAAGIMQAQVTMIDHVLGPRLLVPIPDPEPDRE